MKFSYASVGAVTREEQVRWAGIWLDFCRLNHHNPKDHAFWMEQDKEDRWDDYRRSLLRAGLGGIGMGAQYFIKQRDKFNDLINEAAEYEIETRYRTREYRRAEEARQAREDEHWREQNSKHWNEWKKKHGPKNLREEAALKALGFTGGDPSKDNIKAAYRQKVKLHHPDVGGNAAKFKEVQEAYEFLMSKV